MLQRSLSKTAEARYASCAELGDAVGRAIERPQVETVRRISVAPAPLIAQRRIALDLERTPLSSRNTVAERAQLAAMLGETPRPSPSLRQRRQTQRFQNIAAGLALLVIAALLILGRRPSGVDSGAAGATSASASTAPTASAPVVPRKRPHPPNAHPAAPGAEPLDASPSPEADD